MTALDHWLPPDNFQEHPLRVLAHRTSPTNIGLALLAAASIDKAALEQLRAAQLQAMDSLSKRLLQSMTDSAEVLTPEQRVRLGERMQRRMERRHR